LEFEQIKRGKQIPFQQMLDELVETGYTGTELGDWGYMPTDPIVLNQELIRRNVSMLGAFVPIALKDEGAHQQGIQDAVRTAQLLSAVAGTLPPFLVLADANGTDAERTRLAGRVPVSAGMSLPEWKTFALGVHRVARAVLDETGIRTVFHHHCAGFVETPAEILTLMELSDPKLIGLVFDAGHFSYGAGVEDSDTIEFLDQVVDRVWHFHFKDCAPDIARRSREEQWDYFAALRHGIFCELGKGCVDFPALLRWLKAKEYGGYIVVEQDVLPGMGSPRESARRNREYLYSIESNFA